MNPVNIFLDSNVWHEDKRLRSTAFSSLCAYLKRTGCSIVLPNLVLEEVLGKYERELDLKCQKAFSAGRDVLHYLIDEGNQNLKFRLNVDKAHQVQAFRELLLNPASGIKSQLLDDSKIDIREVYRRGIKRKRPANPDGEELRDVILWLSVLEYARVSKGKVALVTRDKGFWDGDAVHPEIVEDIATNKVEILFHKDIESFNRANALSAKSISAAEVAELLNVRELDEKALDWVARGLNGIETERSIVEYRSGVLLDARWENGTIYEVADGVRFAEVPYRADVEAKIVFISKPLKIDWLGGAGPSLWGQHSKPTTLASLAGSPVEPREDSLQWTYKGHVSMRIINGKVESPDFDSLEYIPHADK